MTSIVRGNSRSIPLRDESVDLIVASPPYFALRDYGDARQIGAEPTPREYLEALWIVTKECWRVLKPAGSMFVNIGDKRSGSGAPGTTSGLSTVGSTLEGTRQQERGGATATRAARARTQGDRSGMVTNGSFHQNGLSRDPERNVRTRRTKAYVQAAFGRPKSKQLLPHRYAIGCEDGLADPDGIGWIVRQDLVWDKPNGMPESVKDRTRDNHEYWFHLTKNGTYFNSLDEIRVPHADGTPERYAAGKAGGVVTIPISVPGGISLGGDDWTANPRGKIPGSVWRIPTEPLIIPEWLDVDEHYAAFPTEWPRRLILGFSPADAVVLDPFGGTGTTAMVARALGRTGISLDLSYSRLATWRVFESDGAAKVADRTNGERQGTLL